MSTRFEYFYAFPVIDTDAGERDRYYYYKANCKNGKSGTNQVARQPFKVGFTQWFNGGAFGGYVYKDTMYKSSRGLRDKTLSSTYYFKGHVFTPGTI